MKKRIGNVLFVLVLASTMQLCGFDAITQRLKKMYGEFSLGKDMYQAYEKNEANLRSEPANRLMIVQKYYKVPGWIVLLNTIAPREDMNDYAKDIYMAIESYFKPINEQIENNSELTLRLKQPYSKYLALYNEKLKNTLLGTKESVIRNMVQENVREALTILEEYQELLSNDGKYMSSKFVKTDMPGPAPKDKPQLARQQIMASVEATRKKNESFTPTEEFNEKRQQLMAIIKTSIENIKKLEDKPLISRLERWHRNQQYEKLNSWVHPKNN